ncbi:unnamed protein product [Didymodactylos carnosus]|uniref:G-protein coupled receptors family 1 profile domain-containing protein n=1 Tax=Didymodactylos carnosus TaxID=1234261 RepID=A0A8S2EL43_9BILA|nr:unnamed protein product [Didymodactylos carnosus]CAF4012958.1 unnamed protein product [Didymodactylos carnosus]
MGTIGNVFSILIFTRKSLWRSCSMYFLASAINNFPVLYFGAITRMLADGYALDPTRYSLPYCRFRNYFSYATYNLSPYWSMWATIDRFCSSSANPRYRQFSQLKVAYVLIPSTILVSGGGFLHTLVFFQIQNGSCKAQSGLYAQFFGIFTLCFYFLPVLLIFIFGLLTIFNVIQQHQRIQPIQMYGTRSAKQIEGQLLKMLLVHLAVYCLLAMPYNVLLAIVAAYTTPSTLFLFIQNLSRILLNASYSVDFYIYTLSARLYRKEFLKLLQHVFGPNLIRIQERTVASTSKANRTYSRSPARIKELVPDNNGTK